MEPAETHQVDLAYDAREATWGHHIAWIKWLHEDPPECSVASFFGHVTPRPKPNQQFLMIMGDSIPVVFVIEWVKYCIEPTDTFFCDATLVGVALEEEVGDGQVQVQEGRQGDP